jgi:CHAT domain-containing protein
LTVADTLTGKKDAASRFAGHSLLFMTSGVDLFKMKGRYDVIDWDLNCYMSDIHPLSSGIYTASNRSGQGYLNVSDLLESPVKGHMSIVRACRADEGESMTGAGLATLAGALFEATPSVLISLWPVEDKPRTVLLEHLYKQSDKNEKVADALRAAQNAMIQAGASPSDWAGHLLFGGP